MAFDIQRSFDIQGFYDEVYGYNTDRRDTPPVDTVSVFDAGYISSSKAASLTKARTGYFALGTGGSGGLSASGGLFSPESGGPAANFW